MTRLSAGLSLLAVSLMASGPNVGTTPADPAVDVVRLPDGGIQPHLAVDAQGGIHVLYFKGEPAHGDLFYTRLDRRDGWSSPVKVNSLPGSAIATGTVRGGHIAIGRNGRVHVAWAGSDRARSTSADNPVVLYTRMDDAGVAFELERNVVAGSLTGLDGGALAADASGQVYVAWHAFVPGTRGEADRRVWVVRSTDDGRTFAPEAPASEAWTGACGCCGVGAVTDDRGAVYVLYRAATDLAHRDTYLLISRNRGVSYTSTKLQEWNINACPMSTYALARARPGIVAAWETDGQVYWTRVDAATGAPSAIVGAPGASKIRKHPSVAANARGETLLVWAEGTGWNKGGALAWQRFDRNGSAIGDVGRAPGVPTWSLGAAAARRDGSFVVVY